MFSTLFLLPCTLPVVVVSFISSFFHLTSAHSFTLLSFTFLLFFSDPLHTPFKKKKSIYMYVCMEAFHWCSCCVVISHLTTRHPVYVARLYTSRSSHAISCILSFLFLSLPVVSGERIIAAGQAYHRTRTRCG